MSGVCCESLVSLAQIKSAESLIRPYIHKTPLVTSSTLNNLSGKKLFFKCENLQKTGSFKARGALNAILSLQRKCELNGVITHSSGNAGQGVAWAAKMANTPCVVVVPEGTPKVKCEAIITYGAQIEFCEPNPTSRSKTCERIAKQSNLEIIHPYDDYNVIAGQATIGVELLEQNPDLDAIFVPTSGGGMISGIALAVKYLKPQVKVYAVTPKGKNLELCLRKGQRLWENPPKYLDTIAEGIKTQQLGQLTFPIVNELVEKQVFEIDDSKMIEAMKLVFQHMKLVIEASSGAGVAAVLSDQTRNELPPSIKNIAVILCGGNVDPDRLPWV